MPPIEIITTQKLQAVPAAINEADDPTGTFAATKIEVTDSTPALRGGSIQMIEGLITEYARIIRVINGTEIVVEQLQNVYTEDAFAMFLGHTNTGNPNGTTLVRNAAGLRINGSKNKAENYHNSLVKDIKNLWDGVVNLPTNQILEDGTVPMQADFNLNKFALKNAALEQLAADPSGINIFEARTWVDSVLKLPKIILNGVVESLVTTSAMQEYVKQKGLPTGSTDIWWSRTAPQYWLLMDGRTIGNAASGATSRANADVQDLFVYLWTNISNDEAPVSGGRGLTALNDFNANKTIVIPDTSGFVIAGLDDMSGVPKNRINSASEGGANSIKMAGSSGLQTCSLDSSQIAPHTHSVRIAGSGSGTATVINAGVVSTRPGSAVTGSTGGGLPHNNVQPTKFACYKIKM